MKMLDILREEQRYVFKGKEKNFEEHVLLHLDIICENLGLPPIKHHFRQRQIRHNGMQCILDLVVRHEDNSTTIFEVKCRNSKYPATGSHEQISGIGQLLSYSAFYNLKAGCKPNLVLIDQKIYERTYITVSDGNLPITLVEFQKDRMFVPYIAK